MLLLVALLATPGLSSPINDPGCQAVLKTWLDGLSLSPSSASVAVDWAAVEAALEAQGCAFKDLWVELWTVDQEQVRRRGNQDHRDPQYFQK